MIGRRSDAKELGPKRSVCFPPRTKSETHSLQPGEQELERGPFCAGDSGFNLLQAKDLVQRPAVHTRFAVATFRIAANGLRR